MKKKDFIKKVLEDSTVFVNEEQIKATIDLFVKHGMLLPKMMKPLKYDNNGKQLMAEYQNDWEE